MITFLFKEVERILIELLKEKRETSYSEVSGNAGIICFLDYRNSSNIFMNIAIIQKVLASRVLQTLLSNTLTFRNSTFKYFIFYHTFHYIYFKNNDCLYQLGNFDTSWKRIYRHSVKEFQPHHSPWKEKVFKLTNSGEEKRVSIIPTITSKYST